jgi:hypothetical protein
MQKQVLAMLKAKEEYDLAVSNGKIRHCDYQQLLIDGLSIDQAISYLHDVKQSLSAYETDTIDCDEYDGSLSVDYYWYETDDEYAVRLSILKNELDLQRHELANIERTRDFYLSCESQ